MKDRGANLVAAFDAYLKWTAGTPFIWFDPPKKRRWSTPNLDASVAADMGLLSRTRLIMKPIFRNEEFGARRAETALHLLAAAYLPEIEDGAEVGILDVKRGDLWRRDQPPGAAFEVYLHGEAAACDTTVQLLRKP